jgi:hypothetical protein
MTCKHITKTIVLNQELMQTLIDIHGGEIKAEYAYTYFSPHRLSMTLII